MLFTYRYISHDIEKLQEYLDFLFYEVWLNANGEFDAEKLNGNPELRQIYIDFGNSEGKWAMFFNSSIEKIYSEFAKVDEDFKAELRTLYEANNDVESLCCDKSRIPVTYDEIKARYPDLEKELRAFYSKLCGTESPFNLEAFGQLNKKMIPSHYEAFMTENEDGVCPFCGISKIDGNNVSTREAYDHYLPKSIYPFNPVNFKNLAPMCDKCNSRNKGTKDPIIFQNIRQLSFYPYAQTHPEIDIRLDLKSKNIKHLKFEDIDLVISSEGHDEEIESWKRVFGIENRYKALCCDKNEGIEWFNTVIDGFENAKELCGITDFDRWVDMKLRDAGRNKLSNFGFLKEPFLRECMSKGLFSPYSEGAP